MAQEVPAKNHEMYFVLIAAICNFTVKILTILIFASECKCVNKFVINNDDVFI